MYQEVRARVQISSGYRSLSTKMTAIFALWIFAITGSAERIANSCINSACGCCVNRACWQGGYCIYGCINGIYGDRCYNDCPPSCTNRTCDRNIAFYNENDEKKQNHYCETCPRGWHRGNTINTVECKEKCPDRCQTCTMAVVESAPIVTCGECNGSFYGGNCSLHCPEHCLNCTSATKCDECKPDYHNKDGITDCSFNCPKHCSCLISGFCDSCSDGFYGTNVDCTNVCPVNCDICSDSTDCTKCKTGYYGSTCGRSCSVGCRNVTCDKDTGHCNCKPHFFGETCDQCIAGRFGQYCDENCSFECKDHICMKDDGKCEACRSTNITGNQCEMCILGLYGKNCEINCPEHCSVRNCTREDGKCVSGCKPNFDGDKCEKCVAGKYGAECTHDCPPNCLNKTCNIEGSCVNCSINMEGTKCELCKAGFYGTNCLNNCLSQTCKDKYCERETGICTSCEHGKYGNYCDSNCSLNCMEELCNFYNGKCNSCRDSYSGDMCCLNGSNCETCSSNTECNKCVTGFHGDECEKRCHVNCLELACEKESGNCSLGCLSGFQGPTCSEAQTLSERTPELYVGGGVFAFAVVVVVVLVIVFLVKRRTKDARKQQSQGTLPLDEIDEGTSKPDEGDNHRFTKPDKETPSYLNRVSATPEDQLEPDTEEIVTDVACPPKDTYYNYTPKIKIPRLYDCVMQKPHKDYQQEFQLLPKGIQKPCTVARQPENVVKNRYAAVYAYDASRIIIKSEPTFYINACYVDGYKTEKAYIASLGPTLNATENFVTFWKMVWNENSHVIVMLTNLEEPSGMKCEKYWPEAGKESTYADVTVSCQGEDLYATYTVRTFYVEKDAARRTLTHFHFTAWPDKRVPDSIITLVEFWQRVRLLAEVTSGPVIVHCSAGVGRTGTYIALDRLTTEGRAEGSVNIFGCVLDMREQRVNMVQTAEQYVYLHKCLAYTLTFDSDAVQPDSFRQYVESAGDSKFKTQFTELQRKIEDTDREEDEARDINHVHKTKNRKSADVPGNRKRPRLHFNRNFNDSDYINASYVDGFKRRDSYILAQTPLPTTVEDFICLLFQENCICIVSLDSANLKSKDIGEYLPADNQTLTVGSFTVTSSKCERKHDYVSKTLTIQYSTTSKGNSKTVHYFQYTNWKESIDTPEDAGSFVQLVKDVEMKAITNSADIGKPTLVHCLTGARRSGVFCVVAILLEKLQTERQASVVNTVRQVRAGRKSAIHNKEQLEFCYRCAAAYTDLFSTYSNFTA